MKTVLISIMLLINFLVCLGQDTVYQCCDTLWQDTITTIPQYGEQNKNWGNFIAEKIAPILLKCTSNEDTNSWYAYIQLRISEFGEVQCIKFIVFNYPIDCKVAVETEFMQMSDWIPATKNGIPISSCFCLPIIIRK